MSTQPAIATLLFTDLVGSTEGWGELRFEGAREVGLKGISGRQRITRVAWR